jgi:solute carrier family 34 (sodium-dependent phosphate cotransporter)
LDPAQDAETDSVVTTLGMVRPSPRLRDSGWVQGLSALLAIYLFVAAIHLLGHGLKTLATVPGNESYLSSVFALANHPIAGLCLGVLVTSIVQSSSFTTSFVVGLVAAGQMELVHSIPVIMGANIGTSVKTTLVSLINLRRRTRFRRSLAAATVHDFFNMLTVIVLLPLEVAFGILSRPAASVAEYLGKAAFFTGNPKKFHVIKMVVEPIAKAADWLLMDVLGLTQTAAGIIEPILAIILLFTALVFLVKMLHGLMKERLSALFSRTLFRNAGTAFALGLLLTATVQSSSITVSLTVPLAGAGLLSVRQIFPYTVGANIGTTVTAILAALAAAAIASGQGAAAQMAAGAGLAVAFGHFLFNVYGSCIFLPLKWIPISLAKGYARLASRRRLLAGVYVLVVFFAVPILLIILVNL